MRLPRAVPPVRPEDTAKAQGMARRARFLGPLPSAALVVMLFVAVALAWLDRQAVITYMGLIAGALAIGLFLGGMFGPIVGRRRWLLEVAEGAAGAHGMLTGSRLHPPPGEPPDVDEAIDLTLRLTGTVPFLLRPGERQWLRATTALLIQTTRRDP